MIASYQSEYPFGVDADLVNMSKRRPDTATSSGQG